MHPAEHFHRQAITRKKIHSTWVLATSYFPDKDPETTIAVIAEGRKIEALLGLALILSCLLQGKASASRWASLHPQSDKGST